MRSVSLMRGLRATGSLREKRSFREDEGSLQSQERSSVRPETCFVRSCVSGCSYEPIESTMSAGRSGLRRRSVRIIPMK